MAEIKITGFNITKIRHLMALAAEMPNYCSLPVNNGRGSHFFYDPMMQADVEACIKAAMYEDLCQQAKRQLPTSYRDQICLAKMDWDYSEDIEDFDIYFDEADQCATVKMVLLSNYNPLVTRESDGRCYFNLTLFDLDEIFDLADATKFVGMGLVQIAEAIYNMEPDGWRHQIIRYCIINFLTEPE